MSSQQTQAYFADTWSDRAAETLPVTDAERELWAAQDAEALALSAHDERVKWLRVALIGVCVGLLWMIVGGLPK